MKRTLSLMALLTAVGLTLLATIGPPDSADEPVPGVFASLRTAPFELLCVLGMLSVMGCHSIARIVFADLRSARLWLQSHRPNLLSVVACMMLCGFLFFG